MTDAAEITVHPSIRSRGIEVRTKDDLLWIAQRIVESGIAPKGMDTRAKIIVAIQCGMEVGFSPMQALDDICVIGNRPCIYGKGLPALGWQSGKLAEFYEWYEIAGKRLSAQEEAGPVTDDWVAVCYTRRKCMDKGRADRFSVADAKSAKLWNKSGPWHDYPKDMLRYRARSRNFKANLADAMKGLRVAEEVRDYKVAESSVVDTTRTPPPPDPLMAEVKATPEPEPAPAKPPKPPVRIGDVLARIGDTYRAHASMRKIIQDRLFAGQRPEEATLGELETANKALDELKHQFGAKQEKRPTEPDVLASMVDECVALVRRDAGQEKAEATT